MSEGVLIELYKVIKSRKEANPKESYVAQLNKKGVKKIAKKLGEEAVEVVIDAMRLDEKPKSAKRRESLKEEYADLMFHMLVLMAHQDIEPQEIFSILEKRLGVSGITEKASRKKD